MTAITNKNFATASSPQQLIEVKSEHLSDLELLRQRGIVDSTGRLLSPNKHLFSNFLSDEARDRIDCFLNEEIRLGEHATTLNFFINASLEALQNFRYNYGQPRVWGFDLYKLLGKEQLLRVLQSLLPNQEPFASRKLVEDLETRCAMPVKNLQIIFEMPKEVSPVHRHSFVELLKKRFEDEFGAINLAEAFRIDETSHFSGFSIIFQRKEHRQEIIFSFSSLMQYDYVATASSVHLALSPSGNHSLVDHNMGCQWALDNALRLIHFPEINFTFSYTLFHYLASGYRPSRDELSQFLREVLVHQSVDALLGFLYELNRESLISLDRMLCNIQLIAQVTHNFGFEGLASSFYSQAVRGLYEDKGIDPSLDPTDLRAIHLLLDYLLPHAESCSAVTEPQDLVSSLQLLVKSLPLLCHSNILRERLPNSSTYAPQVTDHARLTALDALPRDSLTGYLASLILYRSSAHPYYLKSIVRSFPAHFCSAGVGSYIVSRATSCLFMAAGLPFPWYIEDVPLDLGIVTRQWLLFLLQSDSRLLQAEAEAYLDEFKDGTDLKKEFLVHLISMRSSQVLPFFRRLMQTLGEKRLAELVAILLREPQQSQDARACAVELFRTHPDRTLLPLLKRFSITESRPWIALLGKLKAGQAPTNYTKAVFIFSSIRYSPLTDEQKRVWSYILAEPSSLTGSSIPPSTYLEIYKELNQVGWQESFYALAKLLAEAALLEFKAANQATAAMRESTIAWITALPPNELQFERALDYLELTVPQESSELLRWSKMIVTMLSAKAPPISRKEKELYYVKKHPELAYALLSFFQYSRAFPLTAEARNCVIEIAQKVGQKLPMMQIELLKELLVSPITEVYRPLLPHFIRTLLQPMALQNPATIEHLRDIIVKGSPEVAIHLYKTLLVPKDSAPSGLTRDKLAEKEKAKLPYANLLLPLLSAHYASVLSRCLLEAHQTHVCDALDIDLALLTLHDTATTNAMRENLRTTRNDLIPQLLVRLREQQGCSQPSVNCEGHYLDLLIESARTHNQIATAKITFLGYVRQRDLLDKRRFYTAHIPQGQSEKGQNEIFQFVRYYPVISKLTSEPVHFERSYYVWICLGLREAFKRQQAKKRSIDAQAHLLDYAADTLKTMIELYSHREELLQAIKNYVLSCTKESLLFEAHIQIASRILRGSFQKKLFSRQPELLAALLSHLGRDSESLLRDDEAPMQRAEVAISGCLADPQQFTLVQLLQIHQEILLWQNSYPLQHSSGIVLCFQKLFALWQMHPLLITYEEFLSSADCIIAPNNGSIFAAKNGDNGTSLTAAISFEFTQSLILMNDLLAAKGALTAQIGENFHYLIIGLIRGFVQGCFTCNDIGAQFLLRELLKRFLKGQMLTNSTSPLKGLLLLLVPVGDPKTKASRMQLIDECILALRQTNRMNHQAYEALVQHGVLLEIEQCDQNRLIGWLSSYPRKGISCKEQLRFQLETIKPRLDADAYKQIEKLVFESKK